ncbi:MAG TPA: ABC transporter permease [Flexilinea sp.]|jgi:ribose transport system permease protein|nr:ABC transporter permease [Flexilinea sp.]HQK97864.1 ABC transporter permease [Bacteroidia bacterium]HOP00596.1 ABC transporter permease [Flexilinea sp.]HPJ64614.1 ABC transporter permease [Flexilinea sp.]HPR70203.1 ABC transporter permease [Flexilinea sp.]
MNNTRVSNIFKQKAWQRKTGIILSLALLCLFFSIMSHNFFTRNNLTNIVLQSSINGAIALGMTLVIITGGIDLSVGSIMALSSMVAAKIMVAEFPLAIAIAASLVLGIIAGVINGMLISLLHLQPFLVTLGTMSVFRGITLIISDGLPVRGLNSNFLNFMNSMNKSIPIPVIILFLLAAVLAFVIKFTSYGQYVFAVGGNEEATRFACVNIVAVKTITYAISGLASSLAAIIYMGRLAAADPQAGASYEMNAIAAAAIGGASLAGGRGSLVGTIIGVIILGTLSNGLTLLNVQSFYQTLFVGLIILAAATIDHFSNK